MEKAKYKPKGFAPINTARDAVILQKYHKGSTYQELAVEYNLTRQRIWYIIKKGVKDSKPGGRELRLLQESAQRIERRLYLKNQRSYRRYGVGYHFVDMLRDTHTNYHKSALGRFVGFKKNCVKRGIEMNLSLREWWYIWIRSGQYHLYGRYALGRSNYFLGYSKTNAVVRTNAENAAYYQNVRHGKVTPEVYIDST